MNCNNKFFHGYIKNLAVTFDFNLQKKILRIYVSC